jgi:hypothetical protein
MTSLILKLLPCILENVAKSELRLEEAGYSGPYISIRRRLLTDFALSGFIAQTRYSETQATLSDGADVGSATSLDYMVFSDQSAFMGHALVAFALEEKRLREHNIPTHHQQTVVRKLLYAFGQMEDTAGTSGFFYRDAVSADMRGGMKITSDYTTASTLPGADDSNAAMSVDQVVYLFVGFLAVAKWSSDVQNVALVKSYTERTISLLMSKGYEINTTPRNYPISKNRGPDYRQASGYLSLMANIITGRDYFNDPNNRLVEGQTVADFFPAVSDAANNPGYLAIATGALPAIANAFRSDHSLDIKNYSSVLALIRFCLLSTESTLDYSMWAWSNQGQCPWSSLLYALLHNKPVPSNMLDVAKNNLLKMRGTGPSSNLARDNNWVHPWGKASAIIWSLDLKWDDVEIARVHADQIENRYNGIDFLLLEGLVLACEGKPLTGRPCMSPDHQIYWTAPGVYSCP